MLSLSLDRLERIPSPIQIARMGEGTLSNDAELLVARAQPAVGVVMELEVALLAQETRRAIGINVAMHFPVGDRTRTHRALRRAPLALPDELWVRGTPHLIG